MDFATLAASLHPTPRPYQAALAEQLGEHLAPRLPAAIALQAPTGVGKTLVLAHAALTAAQEGQRVVWSTQTTLLRAQLRATLDQAIAALGPAAAGWARSAERRGRADYPSATRTLRLRHALADRGTDPDSLAVLDALARWTGPIGDFVAAYDDLPAPQALLCLTASCPPEEQAAYLAQRDGAAGARIVVQTHALSLIEARFKRLAADLVIFDEADTIGTVAAGAAEVRVALDDLGTLAQLAGAVIAEPIETLRARAAIADGIVWRDPPMAEAAQAAARALRAAARDATPELAQDLRDTAEDLARFATIDAPMVGAALTHEESAGPVLSVAAIDAAGWLGAVLEDRQTVLVSATLGRHEEDDLTAACRRLGFRNVAQVHVSPPSFGTMSFRLAPRDVPRPLRDGQPDPGFFDYAAAMVRQAAATGRTLVLAASYADTQELARRLPPGVFVQQRGQPLGPLVAQWQALPGGVLVTPTAWAGLDVPHGIDNVVIVRLPIPRPDELREAILAAAMQRRGRSADDARGVLFNEARATTMRRLTQGMGRGVRSAEDRCTVWIADPRFPLPANLTENLRLGLTQGPAAGWTELAKAIPLRFRTGGPLSAYGRARIVPAEGAVTQAARAGER